MNILYKLSALTIILLMTGMQTLVTAQDGDEEYRRFSVSANVGATLSDDFDGLSFFHSDLNRRTVGTGNFGLGVEYALLPSWTIGLDYGNTTVEGVDESFTTDVNSFGIKNWFNLNRLYRRHSLSEVLNPFLTFGFGYDNYKYESSATELDDTESYLSFGLGLGVNLTETFELFGQMDYHLGADKFDNREQEYYRSLLTMASVGIRLHLGSPDNRRLNMAPARTYLSDERYSELVALQDEYAQAQQRVAEQEDELAQLRNEVTSLSEEARSGALCCEELAMLRDSLAAATAENEMRAAFIGALRGVNFEFDSSELLPASINILDEAVSLLEEYPDVDVIIEGHTDSIGSNEYNEALSLRRAESVRTYLTSNGISNARLEVEGVGEEDPIASNETDAGRAMNRRVIFILID